MKKIYEHDTAYSILRPYINHCVRKSYRKMEVSGQENLPEEGAVILTPNHCNTLMDALVVLRTQKKEIVFGARADLFNNPFIGRLMTFFRILPMVRQRDGLRNVLKNHETTETIVEIIEHDVPFCLYPEGTHRTKHSLRVLGKGVSRAAFTAVERMQGKKPVYIVPVGLEYGDYFRFRSTSLLTFGRPINVTEFLTAHADENEAHLMDTLRKELKTRMSELITYINDDENYEAVWTLTKMLAVAEPGTKYGECGSSLYKSMLRNKEIVEKITVLQEAEPEKMQAIFKDVLEFEKERKRKKISIYSFGRKNPGMRSIGKAAAALIGLPYFLFSAVFALPMWGAAEAIRSIVKDPAFRNTVSFGIHLVLGPIWYIAVASIAFCTAPWWIASILTILTLPAYNYFYDYLEGARRWISDLRLLRSGSIKKKFKKIVESI